MSNLLIFKEMAKIVKLQFSENGSLSSIMEVARFHYSEAARLAFREYYESFSEDYFVESWNDFVFSVPAFNSVFVLRDLD